MPQDDTRLDHMVRGVKNHRLLATLLLLGLTVMGVASFTNSLAGLYQLVRRSPADSLTTLFIRLKPPLIRPDSVVVTFDVSNRTPDAWQFQGYEWIQSVHWVFARVGDVVDIRMSATTDGMFDVGLLTGTLAPPVVIAPGTIRTFVVARSSASLLAPMLCRVPDSLGLSLTFLDSRLRRVSVRNVPLAVLSRSDEGMSYTLQTPVIVFGKRATVVESGVSPVTDRAGRIVNERDVLRQITPSYVQADYRAGTLCAKMMSSK
jgi:hypothetical protein